MKETINMENRRFYKIIGMMEDGRVVDRVTSSECKTLSDATREQEDEILDGMSYGVVAAFTNGQWYAVATVTDHQINII